MYLYLRPFSLISFRLCTVYVTSFSHLTFTLYKKLPFFKFRDRITADLFSCMLFINYLTGSVSRFILVN